MDKYLYILLGERFMEELNCTFLEFILHQFCKDLDLGNSGLTVRAKHGGEKKRRKKN